MKKGQLPWANTQKAKKKKVIEPAPVASKIINEVAIMRDTTSCSDSVDPIRRKKAPDSIGEKIDSKVGSQRNTRNYDLEYNIESQQSTQNKDLHDTIDDFDAHDFGFDLEEEKDSREKRAQEEERRKKVNELSEMKSSIFGQAQKKANPAHRVENKVAK